MTVDPLDYRKIIGGFATGVTVVTATHGDDRYGMTANSVTSVSLEPLLLLVCFIKGSATGLAVRESGFFGVNILSAAQEELSNRFARSASTWDDVAWTPGSFGGVPLFDGGLGRLQCRVHTVVDGGDHDIIIGEVLDAEAGPAETDPLLFFQGKYRHIAPKA